MKATIITLFILTAVILLLPACTPHAGLNAESMEDSGNSAISEPEAEPEEEPVPEEDIAHSEEAPSDSRETVTFEGKSYTLAFSDEFDFWDSGKWARCPEMERQDAGGAWRDSCSSVKDGNLVITCDVAEDGTPVSGGIRSTGDCEQTFALYHIRFRMDKADGLWYAFWLLSDRMEDAAAGNGATDGAELDIIELVPHTKELEMSVHWDGYGEDLKSYFEVADKSVIGNDFYDNYHELWYLWNRDGYRLYLDGTDEDSLLFDFPGETCGDGTCAVPCDLIISAEYGTWGGKIRTSQLPAHFCVDYVRVYTESDGGQ